MWESMMGKSITGPGLQPFASASADAAPSRPPVRSPRRRGDRKLSQAPAHALQHRGFRSFDLLEIGERFGKTRARHDRDAVAIADDDIAGRDRAAAADDGQADRARAAPAWRIRRNAHRIDRQAQRLEIGEVAHEAVGDEAGHAAIARDAEQKISGYGGASKA